MRRRNSKKPSSSTRTVAGGFVKLPHAVIRSVSYQKLSAYAVKLLLDLCNQFNGKNNGDLSAAYSVMKKIGWRSPTTLNKSIHELLKAGFIDLTRQGGQNKCALYALGFHAIDDCGGKLDVKPTEYPRKRWIANEPVIDINESRARKLASDDKALTKAFMERAKRDLN